MENDALKGELMSSHNIDLEERDLSEAPRLAKETTPRSLIIGGCLAVALFLALLAYGSLPALSPQEIVAMDGYEGCLLYTSPSPRDGLLSRMPSSA